MKKIVAFLLSILMIFSTFAVVSSAADKEEPKLPVTDMVSDEELTKYPIILVPGYTSSWLYKKGENGEKMEVWGDMLGILSKNVDIQATLASLKKSIDEQQVKYFAEHLGEGFNRIFGDMACNHDGSGTTPLYRYHTTPEETNYKFLKETYPEGTHQFEKEIMYSFGERIGYENCFVYFGDFRMGAIELSDDLRNYIDSVINFVNKGKAEKDKIDKVNLFGVSHGGQIAGTYMTRYGHEGKVKNAVLTVPALGGAGIAYDLFNGSTTFDLVTLIEFLEYGMQYEEDYHFLADIISLEIGTPFIKYFIPSIFPTIKYWGSLWDFMPIGVYESIKTKLLDPVQDKKFIEKTDKMHYEVMTPGGKDYFATGFKRAEAAGANVYIMAGYDVRIFTGDYGEVSDSLIPVNASTGAIACDYGKRFSDGYVQKVNTGYNMVSPSMSVDVSTGYTPMKTWLVQGYHHGMTLFDDYTYSLLAKLTLSDKSFDINSMPEYPQFHAAMSSSTGVYAAFNKSKDGYLSSDDTSLVLTNLTKEGKHITVMSVSAAGIDMDFSSKPIVLKPGESREISFKADLPKESMKNFEVTVSYFVSSLSMIGERIFDFTLINGPKVKYDPSKPFTDSRFPTKLDGVVDEKTDSLLNKYYLKDTANIIYNMFYKVFDAFAVVVDTLGKIFKK